MRGGKARHHRAISDQDRAFLQFAEKHELRPGDAVQVEERSAEADSVRLRVRNNRRLTIGARAASKVLVHAAKVVVMLLMFSRAVVAQTAPASEPFRITDNSFLVEEAFNQEKGVFQNIFGMTHIAGTWRQRSRRNGPSQGRHTSCPTRCSL